MAIEEEIINTGESATGIIEALGSIGLWLQAIGIVVILWIAWSIANWLLGRKRLKEIYKIKEDMQRIENKLDEINKKLDKAEK